jgi:hypothetical protein
MPWKQRWSVRSAPLVGLSFTLACGSSSAGTTADSAAIGDPDEQCPEAYLPFSTGTENGLVSPITRTSLQVRLLDASPFPPGKSFNTWTIGIQDATTGAPAANAVITWACAWMEVHGHGTNPKSVESLGNAEYQLSSQNLSMFGPWQIQLWIDPTGSEPAYAPSAGSTERGGHACSPTTGRAGVNNAEFKICVAREL